jgi:hypothetical protein
MRNSQILIFILTIITIIIASGKSIFAQKEELNNGWKTTGHVTKTIDNITFTFPSDGFAFEKKEEIVKQCMDAIKPNCQLIGLNEFKTPIKIKFFRSKEEMKMETPKGSSGWADPYYKAAYLVSDKNSQSPPIKHELMHLIVMLTWGYPAQSSQWMNEGLATYAQNNCNGFKNDQIYRYLLDTHKLISMDTLSSDFYRQPEMIAYHQSAYIVEYLLLKYGLEKFKTLWEKGFENIKEVYGIPYAQLETDLQNEVIKRYPVKPELDWNNFDRCKTNGNDF